MNAKSFDAKALVHIEAVRKGLVAALRAEFGDDITLNPVARWLFDTAVRERCRNIERNTMIVELLALIKRMPEEIAEKLYPLIVPMLDYGAQSEAARRKGAEKVNEAKKKDTLKNEAYVVEQANDMLAKGVNRRNLVTKIVSLPETTISRSTVQNIIDRKIPKR
jgi:hypothetical protein